MVNKDMRWFLRLLSGLCSSPCAFAGQTAMLLRWIMFVFLLIAVGGCGSVIAQEGNNNWSNLLQTVIGGTKTEAMSAIAELNQMVTRDQASRVSDDMGHKIFLRARSESRPGLAQQCSEFLVRLPGNALIVQTAKEDMKHPEKLTDYQLLLDLSYLLRHEKDSFIRYFDEREYKSIPKLLRNMFASEDVVKAKRLKYVATCVAGLLAPREKPSAADQDDPYRKLLLEETVGFVEYVNDHDKEYRENGLPVALVYLMGEVASPSFFDLLLHEYKHNSNVRVAISLGACTGSLQIDRLKSELSDKQMLSLLSVILKTDKIGADSKSIGEAVDLWRRQYPDVKKQCIQRSEPQIG